MKTRKTSRKSITLPGRYYTGSGLPVDVALCDLSVGGCRFASAGKAIIQGTPLQIYVAGSGPHRANVRWSDNGEIGVTFAVPFTPEQIDAFESGEVAAMPATATLDDFKATAAVKPHRFC